MTQPVYYLPQPVVNHEQKRLNVQHQVLKMTLGGLYPAGAAEHVKRALLPEPGRCRAILDVGTGTGAWAEEMAVRYPQTEVVGIDLTPPPRRPTPANCRFEVGNFENGFPQYYGKFDVVHARCIGGGARNYPHVLELLTLCLRPGGVLLLGEGNAEGIWTPAASGSSKIIAPRSGKNDAPVRGKTYWTSRFYDEMVRTIPFHPPKTEHMADMLLQTGARSGAVRLDCVGHKRYFAPIGWTGLPEDNLQNGDILGNMMKDNAQSLFRDLSKLLLNAGFKRDTVDLWLEHTMRETNDPQSMLYIGWDYGWAVRRA